MKFSELQQHLKEKFGIDHLADIGRELGVSPQAVSNWKARNRVPYKYVLKIRKQVEDFDSQVSGQSETNAPNFDKGLSQYGHNQYLDEDTISLTDILLVLARQLKIILITPTIFCTLTIFYVVFISQPVYESNAKFMSSSGSSGFSEAAGLAAQFGLNLASTQSEPQWIYPEIIKSRTLARAMLKRKFDTNKFGPQKPLLQILTNGKKEPTVDIDIIIKTGVNRFIKMIDVQQGKGFFYKLTISASEPVFARDVAIALLSELDSYQRKYNKAKTSEARQFIEERIVDTEKELQDAEEALRNFNDRNRRIENSPALLLEQQRLSREVAVLTGVFTTLKQQLETTKIEEVKESDYVIVLDPPEAPLYRSKPNKRVMVILAGIFGLGLGTIIGFVKEYAKNSDQDDREKMGKVKTLVMKNISDFLPRLLKNK